MTLQIVRQYAQRSRGAGDLLQGVAQVLLGGSVLADEGRVSVLQYPVDDANRAPQIIDGRLQARCILAVDAVHGLARILQRLVERSERFSQLFTNCVKRSLVGL